MLIILQFRKDLKKAYKKFAVEMYGIGRDQLGDCLPDDSELYKRMTSIAGRLGALSAAAVKRAKRTLVFNELVGLQASGTDLTYHVVQNLAHRLLGRGFQNQMVLKEFATAGRTASQKSKTTEEMLKKTEVAIQKKLDALMDLIEKEKKDAREQWKDSAKRKEIVEDWRRQRIEDKQAETDRFRKMLGRA